MRRLLPLLAAAGAIASAGCTSPANITRLGYKTFEIDGPGIPGGSTAPNRAAAIQLCPDGYRVINSIERKQTPDGHSFEPNGTYTNWTIRCL
jgi:hypothetical protein